MRWWWKACQWLVRIGCTALWRIRAYGTENIPREGGALIISNHQSYLDPVLVAAYLPREMHFMARRSLFRNPVFRALIVSCNAFPIERGGTDVKGVSEAVTRLETGGTLLVFPEGTRTRNGTIGPMRAGMALRARRAAVPIVPVLIEGAYQIWPKGRLLPCPLGRLRLVFGRPFRLDEGNGVDAADRVRNAIVGLTGELQGCRIASS